MNTGQFLLRRGICALGLVLSLPSVFATGPLHGPAEGGAAPGVELPPASAAAGANPLSRFFAGLKASGPGLATPIEIVGLGSSVGVGATLPDPAAQAPLPFFVAQFRNYLNRVPRYQVVGYNYSRNGTTVYNGASTDYAAAVAAGHPGRLVLLAYGMNDGQTAQYNAGQTYAWAYVQLTALVQQIRAHGGDAIICTTPHPHTTRNRWSLPAGTAQRYPTQVAAPVADADLVPSVADSTPTISWKGKTIPISYRHYRINEAFRKVAREQEVALVDVEPYWFDAVATWGQDAFFNAGEFVHPNLLGHLVSYRFAIADFIARLDDARSGEASAAGSASRHETVIPDHVDNVAGPMTITPPDNTGGTIELTSYQNGVGTSTWVIPYAKYAGTLALGTAAKSVSRADPITAVHPSAGALCATLYAANTDLKWRIRTTPF